MSSETQYFGRLRDSLAPIEIGTAEDRILIMFLSEARRLDELENPGKHPLYRLQPMSGEAVLSIPIIKADYNRTLEDVYLDIAKQIILRAEDLRILSAVSHDSNNPGSGSCLPSWVPRWDVPINHLRPGLSKSSYHSQPWTNTVPFEEAVKIDGDVLNCHGFIIDTITSTTAPISRDSFVDYETLVNFWKTLISWSTPKYPFAIDKLKLYQRLLTSNNVGGSIMSVLGLGPGNEKLLADFAAYWIPFHEAERTAIHGHGEEMEALAPGFFAVPEVEEMAKSGESGDFVRHALSISKGLKLFETKAGFFGSGPGGLEVGDVVCVFLASEVPFVMRKREEWGWILIGPCFVDGVEELGEQRLNDGKPEIFSIH